MSIKIFLLKRLMYEGREGRIESTNQRQTLAKDKHVQCDRKIRCKITHC